jgi:Homeodomain-like domain-containing protein
MARKPNKKGRGGKDKQPFAQLPASLDIRKVGRPSKYDPSFCDLVIELGAQGKSKAQIAAALGVHRETVNIWTKAHPEFSDAIKGAQDLALAWWETVGQMNMCRQGFNATAFIFQMKNRFPADYKEKHEISGDPERPIVTRIVRTIVDPVASV